MNKNANKPSLFTGKVYLRKLCNSATMHRRREDIYIMARQQADVSKIIDKKQN